MKIANNLEVSGNESIKICGKQSKLDLEIRSQS